MLDTLRPGGVSRGYEALFILTGEHLNEVREILVLSDTGVGAVLEKTPPPSADTLTVRITVAPNAPLAERELRVVTPHGISNPMRFLIGPWPVVEETEPNNAVDQSQAFTLPATLHGALQVADDKDAYRFKAHKGQRIIFEIDSARRGSLMRPVMEIKDAKGTLVPCELQALGLDAHLTFEAPSAGDYDLWIRDSRGQGGDGFEYRIRAGPVPYLESLVPLG